MIKAVMEIASAVFSTVPIINPKNEPMPATKASPAFRDFRYSKANAPNRGPMINPNGGKKSPMIKPSIAPATPYEEEPNFFGR